MLPDTTERALPSHATQSTEDYLVYLKHEAMYAFARRYCTRPRVLDLGCGEGYGGAALADAAQQVVSADYSFDAVTHAKSKYGRTNLSFVVCDAQHLPFANSTFDAVVSFEVIEHIPDVVRYLLEIKRVCRDAGVTLISTPNRVIRLLPFQKPWNRFHLREYNRGDLHQTLRLIFSRVQILSVTAIPEILAIEKRRVKQKPWIAYPKMLAQIGLPQFVYNRLRDFRRHFVRRPTKPVALTTNHYSVDEFMVLDNSIRDCINLMAVCENS